MTQNFSAPLWAPSTEYKKNSHLAEFAARKGFSDSASYTDIHEWSVTEIGDFWSTFWDYAGVIGDKGHAALIQTGRMQETKFFPEARLNWAENLLKRRVKSDNTVRRL